MSVTSIRIEQDLERPLKTAATRMQRTQSWIINTALREFLENRNLEEVRWQDTLEALEDIRMNRIVDGDKVHAWLDSWGTQNELEPPIK